MYERLKGIFTEEEINKLHNANILLVGLGGVGSFCFETLIRSGILKMTIVDFDIYEESNLNRQLYSNIDNIGKKKVEVLKKEANKINPDIDIKIIDTYLDEKTNIDFSKYNYIIDACDSILTKCYLAKKAHEQNIKHICALGIGNRLNPGALCVTTLDKTYNDPLAKKMRLFFHKENITFPVRVVFSKEIPVCKGQTICSYIAASSTMGIILADAVIKDIIYDKN